MGWPVQAADWSGHRIAYQQREYIFINIQYIYSYIFPLLPAFILAAAARRRVLSASTLVLPTEGSGVATAMQQLQDTPDDKLATALLPANAKPLHFFAITAHPCLTWPGAACCMHTSFGQEWHACVGKK